MVSPGPSAAYHNQSQSYNLNTSGYYRKRIDQGYHGIYILMRDSFAPNLQHLIYYSKYFWRIGLYMFIVQTNRTFREAFSTMILFNFLIKKNIEFILFINDFLHFSFYQTRCVERCNIYGKCFCDVGRVPILKT